MGFKALMENPTQSNRIQLPNHLTTLTYWDSDAIELTEKKGLRGTVVSAGDRMIIDGDEKLELTVTNQIQGMNFDGKEFSELPGEDVEGQYIVTGNIVDWMRRIKKK